MFDGSLWPGARVPMRPAEDRSVMEVRLLATRRILYLVLVTAALMVVLPAAAAQAGRLITTGHDADLHCGGGGISPFSAQCHFVEVATNYVRGGAPDPTKPVLVLDNDEANGEGSASTTWRSRSTTHSGSASCRAWSSSRRARVGGGAADDGSLQRDPRRVGLPAAAAAISTRRSPAWTTAPPTRTRSTPARPTSRRSSTPAAGSSRTPEPSTATATRAPARTCSTTSSRSRSAACRSARRSA